MQRSITWLGEHDFCELPTDTKYERCVVLPNLLAIRTEWYQSVVSMIKPCCSKRFAMDRSFWVAQPFVPIKSVCTCWCTHSTRFGAFCWLPPICCDEVKYQISKSHSIAHLGSTDAHVPQSECLSLCRKNVRHPIRHRVLNISDLKHWWKVGWVKLLWCQCSKTCIKQGS